MRAYRSKIGRLPWKTRNELNHRIRDGLSGSEILAWVNSTPEWRKVRRTLKASDINAQNLSEWRSSGYADWLKDIDRTEHVRRMAELSTQFVEQSGGDPAAVGSRLLAGKLLDIIESAQDGEAAALVDAVTSLRSVETNAKKVELAKEQITIKQQALELSRDKFEVQTAELFLRWFEDKKAVAIATSTSSHSKKIKALRSFIHDAIQEDD